MKHNQNWKSQEEKIGAWLELCDLSLELRLEGIRSRLQEKILAKEALWKYLEKKREKNRLINYHAMAKLAKQ